MKFAHDFDVSLKKGEYPQEWLDSAISYRQLKKCIKKVQRELQGLGLGPEILEQLWQNINTNHDENTSRPFVYRVIPSKPHRVLGNNSEQGLMQQSIR